METGISMTRGLLTPQAPLAVLVWLRPAKNVKFSLSRSFLLGSSTLLPRPVEVAILVLSMAVMVPAGYAVFHLVELLWRSGTLGLH